MVTPLMAILFCQSLALRNEETLQLNRWLTLQLSAPADVPAAIAGKVASVMLELRKTIDRLISLALLYLEGADQNTQEDLSSSGPGPEQQRQPSLGPRLREVMVDAVVKMLDADAAYWSEFKLRRREEIDRELERLEQERIEANALEKDEQQDIDEEEDEKEDIDGDDEYPTVVVEAGNQDHVQAESVNESGESPVEIKGDGK
jgi:hypothetical protein